MRDPQSNYTQGVEIESFKVNSAALAKHGCYAQSPGGEN